MLIYGISGVLAKDKEKEKDAGLAAAAALVNGTGVPGAAIGGGAGQPNSNGATAGAASDGPAPASSFFSITPEMVLIALETLEEGPVKRMVRDCLNPIAELRPSAKNLLFDAAFFEVPPLKQIAAFAFVDYFCKCRESIPCLRFSAVSV